MLRETVELELELGGLLIGRRRGRDLGLELGSWFLMPFWREEGGVGGGFRPRMWLGVAAGALVEREEGMRSRILNQICSLNPYVRKDVLLCLDTPLIRAVLLTSSPLKKIARTWNTGVVLGR